MADSLNYWTPRSKQHSEHIERPSTPPRPAAVVPAEFDCVLTQTTDHAAAAAIVRALKRRGIEVFESHNANMVDREVSLHIRSAQQAEAAPIAAGIFVRRRKLKSFPKPDPTPDYGPSTRGLPGYF